MSDTLKKFGIGAVFAVCAILSAFLLWEGTVINKIGHDFSVYYRVANGPPHMAYAPAKMPFPYMPTMLYWIGPLKLLPFWPAYALLMGSSIVALVLACRPYLSKAAMILMLISVPTFRCIRNGQVSALLTALMIWACGTANRAAAGAAFGVVASIKPQLVIMAPLLFALQRDFAAAFFAAATFALAVQITATVFGTHLWMEWIDAMPRFREIVHAIDVNIAPAGFAEWLGVSPIPFIVAGVIAGAWLVYLCRDAEPLALAAAIGLGSILASPYALGYDLVVAAPFIAAMVMKGRFWAGLSLTGLLNPLPLVFAFYELVRTKERSAEHGLPISSIRKC